MTKSKRSKGTRSPQVGRNKRKAAKKPSKRSATAKRSAPAKRSKVAKPQKTTNELGWGVPGYKPVYGH